MFAVLFIDLDRFKIINDSLGHLVGDKLLIAIAKTLSEDLRTMDTVARLGGDEFVILLDDIHSLQDAIAEGVEIREQLQQLKALGCEFAQGYLFAQPLDPRELESKLFKAKATV
ncbi:diguanylate cyclase domain-containing protein [Pleurocapsa sp. FMAR1]|uniref:diguanylate cyclase domain-containing protein n=1 Tax=Pleurocapsa sp. FMAR1 TaxID=3040204 RepID=UPI0029C7D38C|nr:diguanylate cyclase [Pleurocapsa sp. FMAR1]